MMLSKLTFESLCFLENGYMNSAAIDDTQFTAFIICSGLLLVFSVVGSVYVVRRHWVRCALLTLLTFTLFQTLTDFNWKRRSQVPSFTNQSTLSDHSCWLISYNLTFYILFRICCICFIVCDNKLSIYLEMTFLK